MQPSKVARDFASTLSSIDNVDVYLCVCWYVVDPIRQWYMTYSSTWLEYVFRMCRPRRTLLPTSFAILLCNRSLLNDAGLLLLIMQIDCYLVISYGVVLLLCNLEKVLISAI